MAFGAGADGLGHHLHITGSGARAYLHLLDESAIGIRGDVVLHLAHAAEVLAVVADEILHLGRHPNPGVDLLQEATRQAVDLLGLGQVDSGDEVDAIITLPRARAEVVVATQMVDEGLGATSGILLVIHVFQFHATVGVDEIVLRIDHTAPAVALLGGGTHYGVFLQAKRLLVWHSIFRRVATVDGVIEFHTFDGMAQAHHQAVEEGVGVGVDGRDDDDVVVFGDTHHRAILGLRGPGRVGLVGHGELQLAAIEDLVEGDVAALQRLAIQLHRLHEAVFVAQALGHHFKLLAVLEGQLEVLEAWQAQHIIA